MNRIARVPLKWLLIVLLAGVGLAMSVCYVSDVRVPPAVTVPALTSLGLGVLVRPPGHSRLGILPRAMTALYLLPFLHTWVYVFERDGLFNPSYRTSWGYQSDPAISADLCLVGLIGLTGLVLGFLLVSPTQGNGADDSGWERSGGTLGLPAFGIALAVAVALARLFAFPTTIFSARYSAFDPAASAVNFGGAGVLSFGLLVVLLLDAWWDRPGTSRRSLKAYLVLSALLLVGIYFQLLRGDRGAVGLFLAGGAFYVTHGWSRKTDRLDFQNRIPRKRLTAVLVGVAMLFLASQTIGWWRTRAHRGVSLAASWEAILQGRLHFGTWTNALMTSMSAVGDLERGLMDLRWGDTYLDLVASLPPGPLAELLDYTRPLDTTQNLAWQMRYAAGGYSMVVAPLLNFSAFGVLGILTMEGALIAWIERKASGHHPMWVLLQLSVLAYSWGWFWYGELYMVRAVMAAFVAWILYRSLGQLDRSLRAAIAERSRAVMDSNSLGEIR